MCSPVVHLWKISEKRSSLFSEASFQFFGYQRDRDWVRGLNREFENFHLDLNEISWEDWTLQFRRLPEWVGGERRGVDNKQGLDKNKQWVPTRLLEVVILQYFFQVLWSLSIMSPFIDVAVTVTVQKDSMFKIFLVIVVDLVVRLWVFVLNEVKWFLVVNVAMKALECFEVNLSFSSAGVDSEKKLLALERARQGMTKVQDTIHQMIFSFLAQL